MATTWGNNDPFVSSDADAVASVESGNDPSAVSPKGARGTMQVRDATNANPGFGVVPARDDSEAERARVGRAYLTQLQARYGREDGLRAYNWGPGNFERWVAGGRDPNKLPTETQQYVPKVTGSVSWGRSDKPAPSSSDSGSGSGSATMTTGEDGIPRIELTGMAEPAQSAEAEPEGVRASIYKALETLGAPFAKFGEYGADAIRHPIDSAGGIGIGLIKGTKDLLTLPDKIAYRAGLIDTPPQEFPNIDRAYAAAPPIAGVARVAPGGIALGPLGAAGGLTGLGLDLAGNAALSGAEAYGEGAAPVDVAKATGYGLLGAAGGRTAARVLRGATPSDNARTLMRGGVVPTPGALGGPVARAAETVATGYPGVGDVVNYSRASAIRQAAQGETNRALSPVDASVNRAGAGAVNEANSAVSGAYNAAKMMTFLDPQDAGHVVANAMQGWSSIPGLGNREQQWLAQFIRNEVWPVVQAAHAAGRGISGEEFKAMDAKIGEQAFKFSNAQDPLRQPIGTALYDLKNRLFDQLQGPGAQGLRNADAAYASMRPITSAADRAPGGVPTPQQLHRAGVDGPFNTAAREALPPPSGGLVDTLRGAGTIGGFLTGHLGMGTAAATAAAAALYSKDGVGMLTSGLVGVVPYALLRTIGGMPPAQAMSVLADFAARNPGVGPVLSQAFSRLGADYTARHQPELQQ